jgi:RHS repeat-associated protein
MYDLAGNTTSYTDGFKTTITSGYDAAGRLSTVNASGTPYSGPIVKSNSYGAVGLTQATLGNNAVQNLQYNNRMALTSSSTAATGNPLYSEALTYYTNLNLQTANDSVNGNWTYTYDTLNRLSTGVASNTGIGCQFTYDSFGNRTSEAGYQGSCFTPTPFTFTGTATNRIDGYCYDLAGNLLDPLPCPGTGVKDQYYYDGFGNLLSPNYNSATPDSYTVDALGQRIAKWSGSTMTNQYLYGADGQAVAEMDGSGKWLRTNVRMGGQFLAELQGTKTYFRLNDHLGTLRAEFGSDGCLSTYTSLPFGDGQTTVANGCADTTLHHFTGKERDQESGNDYFGARYYASSMGRFMSPDWSKTPTAVPYAILEKPQSLNLYAYMDNNPLGGIDPDGHNGFTDWWDSLWHWITFRGWNTSEQITEQHRTWLLENNRDPNAVDRIKNGSAEDVNYTYKCFHSASCSAAAAAAAASLTPWGWPGQEQYNEAKKLLNEPNTSKGTVDRRDLLGKVPTEQEAVNLIEESGGKVERIEEGHPPGGVSPHENPHINYTTASGAKGTIDIKP